jgi:hypothetical protein
VQLGGDLPQRFGQGGGGLESLVDLACHGTLDDCHDGRRQ